MEKPISKIIFGVLFFVLAVAVAFFITSIVLSAIHNQPIVAEWQTWFGIIKPSQLQQTSI